MKHQIVITLSAVAFALAASVILNVKGNGKADTSPALSTETESGKMFYGYKLSISKLQWHNKKILKATFCIARIAPDKGVYFPDRVWDLIHVEYWDIKMRRIDNQEELFIKHKPQFWQEKINNECFELKVTVPKQANYISIKVGNWSTKETKIPSQS
jgi:hypothetical protein